MAKQAVDNGGWFEPSAATRYEDRGYYNANGNYVSSATDCQCVWETLFMTRNGHFILNRYLDCVTEDYRRSNRDKEYCVKISKEQALRWLIQNNRNIPRCLVDLQKATEL